MKTKEFRPEVWTRKKLESSASKIIGETTVKNPLTGNDDFVINPAVKTMEREELIEIIRKNSEIV